jgi:sulfide:quinone oxidoreductase
MPLQQMTQIGPDLWICPQLQTADFAQIAAKGFRSVINARPDNEAPDQPESQTLHEAAVKAGLTYEYLPVIPNQIREQDVVAFARHLGELPKPILAFCRTGNRCSILFSLVQQRQ